MLFALILSVGRAENRSDSTQFITIDFPGGTLSKLVASLGDQNVKFSIIQTGNLDPVLPAFAVHGERFDTIVHALSRIVEPQGFSLLPFSPGLAVLSKADWNNSQSNFASFQIERKLGTQSIEEFIGAIQAACEFANSDQKSSSLRFKFHPGTKLLFVAGNRWDIEVAHRVIGSLGDVPPVAGSGTVNK
jgi:hypothetical protein